MNDVASPTMRKAAMRTAPPADHRGESDLPLVDFGQGGAMQLLRVDLQSGLWIVRQRMEAGLTLPRHRHTGVVNAYTLTGAWKYLEYPEVNRAGSYLFEPAGSVHTLHVLEDGPTDVWFSVAGANLNLTEEGEVYEVLDAARVLGVYMSRCFKAGLAPPAVIGAEAEIAAYWART